jgi:hypothetical protein
LELGSGAWCMLVWWLGGSARVVSCRLVLCGLGERYKEVSLASTLSCFHYPSNPHCSIDQSAAAVLYAYLLPSFPSHPSYPVSYSLAQLTLPQPRTSQSIPTRHTSATPPPQCLPALPPPSPPSSSLSPWLAASRAIAAGAMSRAGVLSCKGG